MGRGPRLLWLKIVSGVLALALAAGVGVVVFKIVGLRDSITTSPLNLSTDGPGLPVDLSRDPVQILILGTDTRDGTDGKYGSSDSSAGWGQSDVMMLLNMSADRKRVTVVSLPRDLLTAIPSCTDPETGQVYPEQQSAQLNAALSYGGPGCTVAAVNEMTGLEIDHFMMADFNAVKELSTVIGGVDVCVNEPINDSYSKLKLPAGVSSVQGEQALAFLRTRHSFGDGGDRGRIRAQQSFLASMARKIQSEGTLTNVPRLYSIAEAVVSNLTVDDGLAEIPRLLALADRVKAVDLSKVAFVSLPTQTSPVDGNRLVLDEEPGQELFRILREDGDVTAPEVNTAGSSDAKSTDKADEGSTADAGDGTSAPATDGGGAVDGGADAAATTPGNEPSAGQDVPAFDPAVQPVQVVNASGAADRGEELSQQLHALGYLLAAPVAGDAERTTTQIYYSAGFEEVAQSLAKELNVAQANVLVSGDYYGVALSVGKDFASGKQLAKTGGVAGGFKGQTADQVTCQQSGAF
ncbi:LCP family protein [Arthrobacter sp. NPDC055138]